MVTTALDANLLPTNNCLKFLILNLTRLIGMTQERDRLVINHMIYDQEHDTKLFTDVQKPRKGC